MLMAPVLNLSDMAKTTKKLKTIKSISRARPKTKIQPVEPDSAYFLKLVLYVIIGAQWLRLTTSTGSQIPIPVGLIIGLAFASHEHFQLDRKIEYAVLVVATMIGFFAQIGLFATI